MHGVGFRKDFIYSYSEYLKNKRVYIFQSLVTLIRIDKSPIIILFVYFDYSMISKLKL